MERPRLLIGGAVGLVLLPFAAVLAARSPAGAHLGDAFDVAWGFAKPPPMPAAVDVLRRGRRCSSLAGARRAGGGAAGAARPRPAVRLRVRRRRARAGGRCDLFRIGMGNNPAIPVKHAEQPVTPAIRELQKARPARFAGLQPPLGLQPIVPDLAMRYGLYDARGYDYPVERRYDRLWRQTVAGQEGLTPPTMQVDPTERGLRALGLLGATDLIEPPHQERRKRAAGDLRRRRRAHLRQPVRDAADVAWSQISAS